MTRKLQLFLVLIVFDKPFEKHNFVADEIGNREVIKVRKSLVVGEWAGFLRIHHY